MSGDSIVIRNCQGIEELRCCVALQKEVWNFSDADLVPLRMFVVAEKVGGQVMGAFDGSEMVGFALSVPGTRSGHIYLHSHMLAVRKEYRNGGLGRRLKFMQREDALARGIELIEWTFDPLEIKNAFLNLERLGAIMRRYNINQYGKHVIAAAGRIAQRPAHRRMVAEIEASRDAAGLGGESGVSTRRRDRGARADL